jgi:hypothetical protein
MGCEKLPAKDVRATSIVILKQDNKKIVYLVSNTIRKEYTRRKKKKDFRAGLQSFPLSSSREKNSSKAKQKKNIFFLGQALSSGAIDRDKKKMSDQMQLESDDVASFFDFVQGQEKRKGDYYRRCKDAVQKYWYQYTDAIALLLSEKKEGPYTLKAIVQQVGKVPSNLYGRVTLALLKEGVPSSLSDEEMAVALRAEQALREAERRRRGLSRSEPKREIAKESATKILKTINSELEELETSIDKATGVLNTNPDIAKGYINNAIHQSSKIASQTKPLNEIKLTDDQKKLYHNYTTRWQALIKRLEKASNVLDQQIERQKKEAKKAAQDRPGDPSAQKAKEAAKHNKKEVEDIRDALEIQADVSAKIVEETKAEAMRAERAQVQVPTISVETEQALTTMEEEAGKAGLAQLTPEVQLSSPEPATPPAPESPPPPAITPVTPPIASEVVQPQLQLPPPTAAAEVSLVLQEREVPAPRLTRKQYNDLGQAIQALYELRDGFAQTVPEVKDTVVSILERYGEDLNEPILSMLAGKIGVANAVEQISQNKRLKKLVSRYEKIERGQVPVTLTQKQKEVYVTRLFREKDMTIAQRLPDIIAAPFKIAFNNNVRKHLSETNFRTLITEQIPKLLATGTFHGRGRKFFEQIQPIQNIIKDILLENDGQSHRPHPTKKRRIISSNNV